MKKQRIYTDTSTIGGCCDKEFKEWSLLLLSNFQSGIYDLLLSELVDAEIEDAPQEVKEIYIDFKVVAQSFLPITPESLELSEQYLQNGIVTEKYKNDALHIAIAPVANANILVSWNFRHIVHFDKIRKFNAVNLELGYNPISIYSPREVAFYVS